MRIKYLIGVACLVSFTLPQYVNHGIAASKLDCLPRTVTDCSMPYLIRWISGPIGVNYTQGFASACLQHDYCYRFGKTTYNHSRLTCDKRFLSHMQDICKPGHWSEIVSATVTGGVSVAACKGMARTFYTAVRKGGKSAYKTGKESKYCNYEMKRDVRDLRTKKKN